MSKTKVTSSSVDSEQKSIDQVIQNREKSKGEEVKISDGLVEKYKVDIFNGTNSDIGAEKYSAHLFYENATLDDNLSQDKTKELFGDDTRYSQSNVTHTTTRYLLIVTWIVMCLLICVLIIKLLEKRKRRAKKNRNHIQVKTLYS